MPPTRGQSKRKATDLNVPCPGEDAAERKRVLNVLAQRRYRQRQREHVKQLEAQTNNATQSNQVPRDTLTNAAEPCAAQDVLHQTLSVPSLRNGKTPVLDGQIFHGDLSASFFQHAQQLEVDSDTAQIFIDPGDPFATFDENPFALGIDNQDFFDSPILVPRLHSPSTSETTRSSSSSNQSTSWSLPSLGFTDPTLDQAPGTGISKDDHRRSQSRSRSPTSQGTRHHAQNTSMQSGQYTFPDECHLEMPELALLRGCMSIAHRLNVQDIIWSLSSVSPFFTSSSSSCPTTKLATSSSLGLSLQQFSHLPPNLRPTPAQLAIPHHPLIDLLPWPSVRDRLIHVLNQPPQFRPAGAKSPMALIEFVYDIEDPNEGVRISGSDPYDGRNWEVGEKVFKGWWWCFDREVVSRTNELRKRRGAGTLGFGMMGGSVLGEVG